MDERKSEEGSWETPRRVRTYVNHNKNNNNKNIKNNAYVNKDRRVGLWLTGSQRNGLGDLVVYKTRPDHNMLIPQLSVINNIQVQCRFSLFFVDRCPAPRK